MRSERAFTADPASVRSARDYAVATLAGLDPDRLDAIELMVSELATNCVRHVGSGYLISIAAGPREIRIDVTDYGDGAPVLRAPGPAEPSGRGLQIVKALSSSWGIERADGAGKTVWFTVPAAPVRSLTPRR